MVPAGVPARLIPRTTQTLRYLVLGQLRLLLMLLLAARLLISHRRLIPLLHSPLGPILAKTNSTSRSAALLLKTALKLAVSGFNRRMSWFKMVNAD